MYKIHYSTSKLTVKGMVAGTLCEGDGSGYIMCVGVVGTLCVQDGGGYIMCTGWWWVHYVYRMVVGTLCVQDGGGYIM